MKPDKISIFDLFYNQRQFAVPLYQRPYVWTLDAQWQPLWQDIEDKARASFQRQTDVPHFLGAIVTGQRQIFGNQVPSWDIIDGQQRLTTLQIVLKSFNDLMQALGKQKYALDMERITKNDGLTETPDEQFKVWPTNSDRATFRDVMTADRVAFREQLTERLKGKNGGWLNEDCDREAPAGRYCFGLAALRARAEATQHRNGELTVAAGTTQPETM